MYYWLANKGFCTETTDTPKLDGPLYVETHSSQSVAGDFMSLLLYLYRVPRVWHLGDGLSACSFFWEFVRLKVATGASNQGGNQHNHRIKCASKLQREGDITKRRKWAKKRTVFFKTGSIQSASSGIKRNKRGAASAVPQPSLMKFSQV